MFNPFDHTVYSFSDLTGVIYHPLMGNYAFTGQGVGQITIEMDNDMTSHDFGVDGSNIISRISVYSGKMIIQCQQMSNIHNWLMATFNAVKMADPVEWARMSSMIRRISDGNVNYVTGISFERVPPKVYQAEGQMVDWVLWAGDIRDDVLESDRKTLSGALRDKIAERAISF